MFTTPLRVILILVLTLGVIACQSKTEADSAAESDEKDPAKEETPEKAEKGEDQNTKGGSGSSGSEDDDSGNDETGAAEGPTPADTVTVSLERDGGHTAMVAFAKPEGWKKSDAFDGPDVFTPDVQKNEMLWARFDFSLQCLGDCSELEANVEEQMAKLKGELNPAEHSYDIVEDAFPDSAPAIAVGHRYPPEMEKQGFSSQLMVRCFWPTDAGIVVGSGSAPLDHQDHYLPAMVEMCTSAVVTVKQ